jgi:hypothetical protein
MSTMRHSSAATLQQDEDPLAAPVTNWRLNHHGIDFGMFERSHAVRIVRILILL